MPHQPLRTTRPTPRLPSGVVGGAGHCRRPPRLRGLPSLAACQRLVNVGASAAAPPSPSSLHSRNLSAAVQLVESPSRRHGSQLVSPSGSGCPESPSRTPSGVRLICAQGLVQPLAVRILHYNGQFSLLFHARALQSNLSLPILPLPRPLEGGSRATLGAATCFLPTASR